MLGSINRHNQLSRVTYCNEMCCIDTLTQTDSDVLVFICIKYYIYTFINYSTITRAWGSCMLNLWETYSVTTTKKNLVQSLGKHQFFLVAGSSSCFYPTVTEALVSKSVCQTELTPVLACHLLNILEHYMKNRTKELPGCWGRWMPALSNTFWGGGGWGVCVSVYVGGVVCF